MLSLGMRLFIAVAFLLGSVFAQAKLRIMPLGDSITEAACWRTTLWEDLVDAGVADKIEFVGSMTSNPENCASHGTWDMRHEGHSGAFAVDIANYHLWGWLTGAEPDIVMFMLGTNDVMHGKSTTDILNSYTKMVHQMRQRKPDMKIIVDLVIPLVMGPNSAIMQLNNAILGWLQAQSTEESPIFIADCFTDFPDSALRDGIHPNAHGDAIITSRVFPVLRQVINFSLEAQQLALVPDQEPLL